MKYSTEITIALPVEKVVELFDNPENLKYWQPGLESFEHLSGTPGHAGAKSRLRYKMGKRTVEMIETITKRDLPDIFSGTYEAQGVLNISVNRFVPLSDNSTKYISEQEFRFKGMMKLMAMLMPGMFKKQSLKYLQDFKTFAENEAAKS